ncbi:MAG: hypothetical protein JNK65_07515 [Deltaproteobacteria bacterium]|nr:hypothetical protein [Deltaproteobacteria bacterium]
MKKKFPEYLQLLLEQKGYRHLKPFYDANSFSFTYEYLRQMMVGERTPSGSKLLEIAEALQADPKEMQEIASDFRLERKIRHHYRLPTAPSARSLSEKVQRYGQKEKERLREEAKILKSIQRLADEDRKALLDYLQYLKQKSRRKNLKNKL